VSFGQRGSELWLTVRTHGNAAAGPVCVALARQGRVCIEDREVRFRGRVIEATVRRRSRTLMARFYPRALRLPFGRVRWSVITPADRAPDRGHYVARISAYGAPRCFGAAARGCVNPSLRRTVVPGPSKALLMPDAPCRPSRSHYRVIVPCRFGFAERPPYVALIGDSHAAHWRAAVDVAAKAAGWRAVSITSPGCSFSTEVYPAPPPIPARCRRHSAEALTWLRRHPSVRTVVTSNAAGRGLSPEGYLAMWRRLPKSVRRIHVIRDVPRVSHATAGCVASVKRRRRRSVRACPVSRASAFPADTSAQAAARGGRRVRLLDFSRFFCGARRCYPVVGGAYVYRDFNHMNPIFSSTLGPYLLRAMIATTLVGTAALALPEAAAAKRCAPPKYPGNGYFTSLQVARVPCERGRAVALEHHRCRTRTGRKGRCSGRVLGYRCRERRVAIPTEFNSRVTCTRNRKQVVFTYQQNT
jgi:hypothetical protein